MFWHAQVGRTAEYLWTSTNSLPDGSEFCRCRDTIVVHMHAFVPLLNARAYREPSLDEINWIVIRNVNYSQVSFSR